MAGCSPRIQARSMALLPVVRACPHLFEENSRERTATEQPRHA
jgi:hypothetical protein